MDVLRRMVGDEKLTYLGFSYGTYLGEVYANMFPDRVRAVAIDGVVDPTAWAGTTSNAGIPQTARIRSGEAGAKALHEILVRCGKTGPKYCSFAADGDPVTTYAAMITALKAAPVKLTDPATGEVEGSMTYANVVSGLLDDMYDPHGSSNVADELHDIYLLQKPPAPAGTAGATAQKLARTRLLALQAARKARVTAAKAAKARGAAVFGYSFPYDNSPEGFQAVLCTDGLNPPDAAGWPAYADAADLTAPDFGRMWTWGSAACASKTWTIQDEDRYAGPFTHQTVDPVLVVGNHWDPATNYDNAVKTSQLLPNSRLLSSDSWGHTAYGSSACVTGAVDSYLLTQQLPAIGTTCVGDTQPFTGLLSEMAATSVTPSHRAPVVPILPAAWRW
jgi:pimeloyl-ACP methyl ester carboxylesterase